MMKNRLATIKNRLASANAAKAEEEGKTTASKNEGKKNPDAGAGQYDLAFFQNWQKELGERVMCTLPTLCDKDSKELEGACRAVQRAEKAGKEAQQTMEKAKKEKPVNQKKVDAAKREVEKAKKALEEAMDKCQKVPVEILDEKFLKHYLSDDFDDKDLITYLIITQSTPKKLADWCEQNDGNAKQLLEFLRKGDWLKRQFVQAGGAKKGNYPIAVQIFRNLQNLQNNKQQSQDSKDPVLRRLALAVALELADPPVLFGDNKQRVDPPKRYVHYEEAYLLGELDPAFAQFSVWEMRQIVNSDATEEELAWGRQSLRNYRPDLAINKDCKWRYCMIVRTDVDYTAPDWYKKTRSYDQILSGGGKCGPRAWYGRFICKAFGIPTWGVRQQGHAAMSRWTESGWVTNLGAGFQWSWWEDQGGSDFLLETQARTACRTEEAYMKKVLRLEWLGFLQKENAKSVRRDGLPSPDCLWWTLSMMQRKRLAHGSDCKHQKISPRGAACGSNNLVRNLSDRTGSCKSNPGAISRDTSSGAIFIPADACSSPDKGNKKVSFMKSFSGGQQLFLKEDAVVEYTLPAKLVAETRKYKLICCVCTAHRKEQPVQLTVNHNDKQTSSTIKLPYTMGFWEDTEPVAVELGGRCAKIIKLSLARPKQKFGFSLREIKLVPLDAGAEPGDIVVEPYHG
jgi:hypothetical protein